MAFRQNATLCGIVLLAACGHEVRLNYQCDPAGALIFEQGVGSIGTCPATAVYNDNDPRIQGGNIITDTITISWPSGTELIASPMMIPIEDDGTATVTFVRPVEAPNAAVDARASWALLNRVRPRDEKRILTRYQDKDVFAALNHNATCLWSTLTFNADTVCP